MERAQRQSDNVYRFIKRFAGTPRRSESAAVRPKGEVAPPVPATVRRPDTPTPPETANTPAVVPDVAPDTPVSTANSLPSAPAEPASAASAAPPVATATAAPEPAAEKEEEEEEELQLVEQVQPQFPRGMQGAVDGGKVTVAFTVQPNGSVTDTSVVSATNRRFGKPARDAVAQWRFAPIKVARPVQVEINFNPQ